MVTQLIKSGFKPTDIGDIPEDWDLIPFKEISSMHGRIGWQGLKQSEFTMNYDDPFLITGMNFKDGEIDWNEVYHIPKKRFDIAKEIQLKPNDVLMTKDGTIGKILIIKEIPYPHKASLNSHLLVFRPKGHSYVPVFLYYQLSSSFFKNQIEISKSGTTFFGISQESVGKFKIILPKRQEQESIGLILNDTDGLINKLGILIEKKKNIKQGAMQELLTGKKRLPGFKSDLELKRLDEISNINMGQSPDSNFYNEKGQGIPLIQGNADIERRRSVQRVWTTQITKTCDKDDLLITVRAPVGSVGVATKDSCIGRGVCSLKPKGVDRSYLYHLLIYNERLWKKLEQGSTFTSANSAQIGGLELFVVKIIKEQSAIAQVLSDMDFEIEALEYKRDKCKLLKVGLMQQLLTGRIRLKCQN
jgi:type I restriction enzyme S subunit